MLTTKFKVHGVGEVDTLKSTRFMCSDGAYNVTIYLAKLNNTLLYYTCLLTVVCIQR